MRILTALIAIAAIMASMLLWIKLQEARLDTMVTITDREYWRHVASSPNSVCHLRGGKYTETGFTDYFGGGKNTHDYVCKGAEH